MANLYSELDKYWAKPKSENNLLIKFSLFQFFYLLFLIIIFFKGIRKDSLAILRIFYLKKILFEFNFYLKEIKLSRKYEKLTMYN